MNIDVNLLTTTTACDSMIEILEAKKLQIQRKARNLEEALVRKVRTIQDIKAGIISIRATITGYQSTITLITNDKEQRSLELKIERRNQAKIFAK